MITISLLAGCASTTTTRTHPSLNEQLNRVNTVVIIPPRVEIEYVTLTGENERLIEREEEISSELMKMAKRELLSHGYEVVSFDFAAAIANDHDFAYKVTQIREGFDRAKRDLRLGQLISESEAKMIQTSVGEAVNIVADKSGADAVLLMRYAGFDKSSGYVAKDVGTSLLVGVLTMGTVIPTKQTSGAITEFALIDGVTGDVLWANTKGGLLNSTIGDKALETLPLDIDPNGSK